MAKQLAKVEIRCPHCGAHQQEPAAAKSTFCRKCSEYFSITPATLAGAQPPAPAVKPKPIATAADRAAAPAPEATGAKGLLDRFEHLLGKPKNRVVRCFECDAFHEVSSSAHSSTCKACGAYIDLQDYKITGSFSRNITTRGSVYLSSKGDLSSSKIICDNAILHGKMRGNMRCMGKLTIRAQGRLPGTLEAHDLVIEKGSDLVIARPLRVSHAEIGGKVAAQIICDSQVMVLKSGFLEGPVTAKGFNVEKGGWFQGELTINPRQEGAAPNTAAAPPLGPPKREAQEGGGLMQQNPALG